MARRTSSGTRPSAVRLRSMTGMGIGWLLGGGCGAAGSGPGADGTLERDAVEDDVDALVEEAQVVLDLGDLRDRRRVPPHDVVVHRVTHAHGVVLGDAL